MSAYFSALSEALKQAGIFQPCLLLDRDRLDGNIALVKEKLDPGLAVRMVDKSLACLPLLAHIGKALGTDRFMTFHPPISAAVLKTFPDAVMAYEAHAPHIPGLFGGPAKALAQASERVAAFVARLGAEQRSILNIGGSKTALLHHGGAANEVSMGSAFVLPSDFDTPGLEGFQPAAFIVTPILKVVEPMLPGPPAVSRLLQALGRFPRKGCYLYGGKWMAEPVFPEGMKTNGLLGLSSNQQFMGLPAAAAARPGDYAFLRPTQSEAVLQQFGPIAVLSGGRIVDRWPVLPMM
jgi:D-serine deaminase-like pyridoxal phosphate-dependent protein